MQPMTIMFKVVVVDMKKSNFSWKFESQIETKKGEIQHFGKSILPYFTGHVLLYCLTLSEIVTVNMTNSIDLNEIKAKDLTKASIECELQIIFL